MKELVKNLLLNTFRFFSFDALLFLLLWFVWSAGAAATDLTVSCPAGAGALAGAAGAFAGAAGAGWCFSSPGSENWSDVIPYDPAVCLKGILCFQNHIVLSGR